MDDLHEDFTRITEELQRKAQHIGLYMIGATVASDNENLLGEEDDMLDRNPDVKAMIESGEASVAIMAQFTIGDLAFDTRVQNVTQHEVDMQFREIMPTDAEVRRDDVQSRLSDDMTDDDLLDAFFDGTADDDNLP